MFDTLINLTLQRNDMTCNNISKSLNTVKFRSFFFKEKSEGKGSKNNSLFISNVFFYSLIDSELLC